ncbi:hypothetical protein D9615_005772 [Tricholomella constricta]|uniref:Fungal lipase-type domain-containing protein n=1 Tax=Tricholomella constricta TaxID=117010 RepID=A0A8H5M3N4_9AGAR|nr:hypothetical protein D9615_005772 [Tricholomella constricta]
MSSLQHSVISEATYKDLIYYFKYASSAYNVICPRPNGNTLVLQFSNAMTDIQGFVARDSKRKEIVIAIRGRHFRMIHPCHPKIDSIGRSASIVDLLLDTQVLLVPLITPGVSAPPGTKVHTGFLVAWNSIVVQVLAIVTQQLKAHFGYSLVTVGHSLGGALATLAAVTLKQNFPETEIRTYSYGAPRIGNKEFAEYVNADFGPRAFRVVHTTDGVPTIISTSLGYHHHGIEYWQSEDPASKDTTFQCSADGEDPTCSASIPSRGITPAHAMETDAVIHRKWAKETNFFQLRAWKVTEPGEFHCFARNPTLSTNDIFSPILNNKTIGSMAAPTQEYPPWLTPVPTVVFDGNGALTTSTTVLYLPLTYYGPSIPLNSDWTYGGLTPPASTTEPSSTSETQITTTTAIPSSLPPTLTSSTLTSSTSAATSTSSFSSSVSLSSSFTTSISSASPTSTPTSIPPIASNLSRGQLIGVIVASVLGFIFLFIVALLLYLCCKGRRSRAEGPPFTIVGGGGLDEGYEVVGRDGRTTWGERSPRHSGEEADPFLRRSGAGTPSQAPDPEMGGRSSAPPYVGIPRVPVPPAASQSSAGSSSTNHSGYGVLIERPTLNLLPTTTEELDRQRRGHILSPEEQRRLEDESVLPPNADYSPLVPPPRLVDPDLWAPGPDNLPFTSKSSQFSLSAYPDADEAATLLTARRVRVEDLASRSPPQLTRPLGGESSSNRNSGGFLSNLGLGRLSWFKNLDGHSRRNSRTNSFFGSPLNDDDLEIGKALLGPEMSETQTSRPIGLGMGFDGERPMSTASGRSVATVYHDANSSIPGTPISGRTPLAPLPRALTPSGPATPQPVWPPDFTVPVPTAPATDLPDPSHSYSTSITNVNHGLPVGHDILDTPAPAAVSPFASTSSFSSLRDTATGSSTGLSAHPFPPGLGVLPTKSWTDESSTATHVNPPLSILSNQHSPTGISIDVLEQAPPAPGEGWRSLAAEQGILGGRRTTFGQFISPPDIASEEVSLYSMRSHLSPAHSRSTGSAPASRRDLSGSFGSGSSRPSAFSAAARTHSSGHSLAHSGSISSDARKRGSPAMSAFGSRSRSPPALSPVLNAPPTAHFVPERAGMHRMAASLDIDAATAGRASSPEPTSPLSQLSSAPWAAGLDNNWTPM